jgi:hypothetical protein
VLLRSLILHRSLLSLMSKRCSQEYVQSVFTFFHPVITSNSLSLSRALLFFSLLSLSFFLRLNKSFTMRDKAKDYTQEVLSTGAQGGGSIFGVVKPDELFKTLNKKENTGSRQKDFDNRKRRWVKKTVATAQKKEKMDLFVVTRKATIHSENAMPVS